MPSLQPSVTCSSCTIDSSTHTHKLTIELPDPCTTVITIIPPSGYAISDIQYAATLSRNGNTYSLSQGKTCGTGSSCPEINVVGNGNNIPDGPSSPTTTNYTDFGTTTVNSPVDKSFAIENSGNAPLTLAGSPIIALSTCSMFTITSQPTSPIAASGATTPFTIRFNPTTAGTHTCLVSIANDDLDENPYDFTIKGTASASTPPAPAPAPVRANTSNPFILFLTGLGLLGFVAFIMKRQQSRS